MCVYMYIIFYMYESRGCDVIKYRGSFYNTSIIVDEKYIQFSYDMIPDDGSRLKVIENGVLREEREL